MRNARFSTGLGVIVFVAMAAVAVAAPGLINYQGRLTDAIGQPVTTAVNVRFTFWDAETGGALIGGSRTPTPSRRTPRACTPR